MATDASCGTLLLIELSSSSARAAVWGINQECTLRGPVDVKFENPLALTTSQVERALVQVLAQLGDLSGVRMIAPSAMGPSLCVMGTGDSPVITHADRRSVPQAKFIEQRTREAGIDVLELTGNRPYPGGVSATSLLWLRDHQPDLLRSCQAIGHLNTWLGYELTGQFAIDYSQASFTGFMDLRHLQWNQALLDALDVPAAWLPSLVDASTIIGSVTPQAAKRFGIPAYIPVLAGLMDTSAAVVATDLQAGTMVHSLGTTDVLAMLLPRPMPGRTHLSRHVGTAGRYLAVCTLASGGSTLLWLQRTLFADLPDAVFFGRVADVLKRLRQNDDLAAGVVFEPYLAGSRLDVEQRTAAFKGITLGTTRDHLLAAALAAYRWQSADAINRLISLETPTGVVIVTGGGSPIANELHADWPALSLPWRYLPAADAQWQGLAKLAKSANATASPA